MYDIYTVGNNETINSIAMKLNISPMLLSSINNNIVDIKSGVTLLIPKKNNEYFDFYTINKGDTLFNIAKKYNVNMEILAMLNGLDVDDYIYDKQVIMVPKNGINLYITAEGDTLQNILKGINGDINKLIVENPSLYLLPEQLIIYKK